MKNNQKNMRNKSKIQTSFILTRLDKQSFEEVGLRETKMIVCRENMYKNYAKMNCREIKNYFEKGKQNFNSHHNPHSL